MLADLTEGMTGADIGATVNAAAMNAIKDHVKNKGSKLKISLKDFESGLAKIKSKRFGSGWASAHDLQGNDRALA